MLFRINDTARIVRDIEIRYTQSGSAVASTAVVKSRKWKDKGSGSLMEEACFIDVVAFGQTAEHLNRFFSKGDIVEFEGELQQDKWEDGNGNKRSKHSIKINSIDFGPCKKSENNGYTPKDPYERGMPAVSGNQHLNAGAHATSEQPQSNTQSQLSIPEIDINDEIPF